MNSPPSPGSPQAPLLICFLLVLLLPSLPFYLHIAGSMALGTTLAAVLVAALYWVHAAAWGRVRLPDSLEFLLQPSWVVALLFAFILAHTIVAAEFQSVDLIRTAETLLSLALLVIGAMTLGLQFAHGSDSKVDSAIKLSFWILCVLVALRLLRLEPAAGSWPKAMFPYTEISHFSLAFGPVLMYRSVLARPSRALWWIFFAFVCALVLQSVALLCCCFLIAMARRRLIVVVLAGLLILIPGLPLELTYFSDRVDFSSDTQNLSTLVYLQGWEQIWESFGWSSGWGVGFEQMGFRATEAVAATVIRSLMGGEDSNVMDGGFVFAKLASEFGVFGMLLTLIFTTLAARSMQVLRRGVSEGPVTFARCVVVAYGIDMFVRGTGYFSESTMLFLASVSVLFFRRSSLTSAVSSNPDVTLRSYSLAP